MSSSSPWWKQAVIYQIYPHSYRDTTGNGIGDLPGIIEKLDYLQEFGVDAIWLSPIFLSPMADFGYDVSDHIEVHPEYGTLSDVDVLIEQTHARGMRLLLDFVPNHTSHQHPWFQESKSSRTNSKRDWYIWRDASVDGGPPNNWLSYFSGSSWTWDEDTKQYYLHSFLEEQPDLNWRNPDVVDAMHSVLRYWLDRGVDGFRVDAVMPVIKDDQFRDNPLEDKPPFGKDTGPAGRQRRIYSANRPELHGLLRDMRDLVEEYPGDRILLGEVYSLDPQTAVEYYGRNDELHLVLNVTIVNHPWEAAGLQHYIEAFDSALPQGAQPTLVMGSHDEPRLASRWGEQQARVAAIMLLTLRGTPIIYYGDEIGMLDGDNLGDVSLDPWPIVAGLPHLSRDVARTPMQWDSSEVAGFSTTLHDKILESPWLPIHSRYKQINVSSQQADPRSLLSLYAALLKLRKSSVALVGGSYQAVADQPEGTYVYVREAGDERLAITLNLGPEACQISFPGEETGRIMLSSYMDRQGEEPMNKLSLREYEGVVVRLP